MSQQERPSRYPQIEVDMTPAYTGLQSQKAAATKAAADAANAQAAADAAAASAAAQAASDAAAAEAAKKAAEGAK